MLYDPKWERTTKADPFTLESLIVWLESRTANGTYCYQSNGHCLLGQYFKALGFKGVSVGGTTIDYDSLKDVRLPASFQDIAWESPRTFGAALKRARAALSSQEGQ